MNARRLIFTLLPSIVVVAAMLPSVADADGTIAPPPIYSGLSGLPDGRVYEQVSPANKQGYAALINSKAAAFGNATADGEAVWYFGNGPLAEPVGDGNFGGVFVSQRKQGGWSTRGALPRSAGHGIFSSSATTDIPSKFLAAADLSRFAFYITTPEVQPPDQVGLGENLFLAGPDPLVEPAWIGRPEVEAQDGTTTEFPSAELLGGTPDLSTVYFSYEGNLLPQDSERLAHHAASIYQYRNGVLGEVGLLPNGTVNPFGAQPAARASYYSPADPDSVGNEVSVDGTHVFFVSPEPSLSRRSTGCGECSTEAPQLYVRVTSSDGSQKTVLLSQSQLPGHLGEAAPDGALPVKSTIQQGAALAGPARPAVGDVPSYVYASPDGSHAFFQSTDQLTSDAPADSAPKLYDFDVNAGSLRYLPGVTGIVVGSTRDGSSFLFENTASSPFELDRWSEGIITKLTSLPKPPAREPTEFSCNDPSQGRNPVPLVPAAEPICLGPVRLSADGTVVVFGTQAPIAGFNDGGGFFQIFRYDLNSNELSCVSCPPAGVTPASDAVMSNTGQFFQPTLGGFEDATPGRMISATGEKVFFQDSESLVPQDTNGLADVYEWENGTVFLLSSGQSSSPTTLLDNGESGGDVFFATAAELVLGDNDGAYDIYDARVPRPGDNPPPSALPCQGDVCQGPPSVPNLLGAPPSATFDGIGNLEPQRKATPVTKAKPKKKAKKATKKKRTKKKGRKTVRSARTSRRMGRGK